MYLSSDPSLDQHDLLVGQTEHWGYLAAGASYSQTIAFDVPEGTSGTYYLIGFADSDVLGASPSGVAAPSEVGGVQLFDDVVPEFLFEGNNTTVVPLEVVLQPAPDLQVASVLIPERIQLGETLSVSYTVTNAGTGEVPATQDKWKERIYLSADAFLDPASDRFLAEIQHDHDAAFAAGASYTVTRDLRLPRELLGPFYVFVWTDAPGDNRSIRAAVFEGARENNNQTGSPDPLLIELPPPADLEVTAILAPDSGISGDSVDIEFTVTNTAAVAASGNWADAVYLSADATWDLDDRLLGRVSFGGTLLSGESYTAHLQAQLPPARAGQYRIVVRPDIFNDVYEGTEERDNFGFSADELTLSVPELHLGAPLDTTLSPGESRLYRIAGVAGNETLRVRLDAADDDAANELYLRYGDVASGFAFDASSEDPIAADQRALVPTTIAGDYYVLVQGRSGSRADAPVRLVAEVLPFQITDVSEDQGGDSRWVTMTIRGAGFKPDALVKLVRPGIAEYEPVRYEVLDATRIMATFDLAGPRRSCPTATWSSARSRSTPRSAWAARAWCPPGRPACTASRCRA
jgi:hypothetical protein